MNKKLIVGLCMWLLTIVGQLLAQSPRKINHHKVVDYSNGGLAVIQTPVKPA
jgi:hypothetical protein